jgi:ABC-type tungstate transport system permease subunit
MRTVHVWALLAAILGLTVHVAGQVSAGQIRVLSPGVVYNAGLLDLAEAFTKNTGTRVNVTSVGLGRIVNDIKTRRRQHGREGD